MTQAHRRVFNPTGAPNPIGAYSLAAEASGSKLLYVAGQVGLDVDGNLAGNGDVAAQTNQIFQNIGAVLAGAEANFSNVVEFTTYVVGRSTVQPFIEARTQIFPGIFPSADYPPNTLLIVDGLVREDLLVEIKAVASLP